MWEPGQVLTQLVLGGLGPAQGDWLCRPGARLCLSCGWDVESVLPTSVPCAITSAVTHQGTLLHNWGRG